MSKKTFWLIIAAYVGVAIVFWPAAIILLVGDAIACKCKGFSILAVMRSVYSNGE